MCIGRTKTSSTIRCQVHPREGIVVPVVELLVEYKKGFVILSTEMLTTKVPKIEVMHPEEAGFLTLTRKALPVMREVVQKVYDERLWQTEKETQ